MGLLRSDPKKIILCAMNARIKISTCEKTLSGIMVRATGYNLILLQFFVSLRRQEGNSLSRS